MSLQELHDKYLCFINGYRIAIVEKNDSANEAIDQLASVSTAGLTIRIEYLSRPIPFSDDLTKSSELPDQFHEALTYKVISDLCKLPGERQNLQLAQYFDNQYNLAIREGKKYASRRRVSGGTIIPVDY